MVNILPSSPPPTPTSRTSIARRSGLVVCGAAVLLGGLGHVIGWSRTEALAAVAGSGAVLFFVVRGIRRRRSGGLPPGLRGMPPGLLKGMPRGARGGRIGGLPGFPVRGMRVPRGGMRVPGRLGRGGLPAGMRLPGGLRAPSRSRMPGLPGRSRGTSFRPSGARGIPSLRRSGRSALSRSGLGSSSRSPFRSSSRPGSPSPSRSRTGGRWGLPRAGGIAPGSRSGSRGSASGPARVSGVRRLVPPRMRPASWTGGTPAPARGLGRLIPPRFRPAARGTVPGSAAGGTSPFRTRRARRAASRPPKVRVRGRGLASRLRGTPSGHRLFSPNWVIHHVGRYGKARARRKLRRQIRKRPRVQVRKPRARKAFLFPVTRRMRGVQRTMRAFLIRWKSKHNRAQANGTRPPLKVTIVPPSGHGKPDPYARRRPNPAPPFTRPAPPAGDPFAGWTGPASGGHNMAGTSQQVQNITQAITDVFANFNPEKIVPDFENFISDLHLVPEALAEALKKFAARIESEWPVNNQVADAVREMVPGAIQMGEAAGEANTQFRSLHQQELEQHHNPRTGEGTVSWNL